MAEKKETQEKKKSYGCMIGIIVILVLPGILFKACTSYNNKYVPPEPKYSEDQVIETEDFTLLPGEEKVFKTTFNGEPTKYTVKWTSIPEGAYLWCSIHGYYGADGADRIRYTNLIPSTNGGQPTGAGNDNINIYYLRMGNKRDVAVSGTLQRWGKKLLPPAPPTP